MIPAKTTAGSCALVVGANGFLGSHVVKALALQGRKVRALVRQSSKLEALTGLDVEICYGDVLEPASLKKAMHGCATVFHCAVDTRAWLSDPSPLYRCNVDGLVNSMDAALACNVQRFIFTSSIATIGLNKRRMPNESDIFDWHERAPAYILARVAAEERLFAYCRDRRLPGIAMCVANTYGPEDFQPTPHGQMLWLAASSRIPVLNCGAPCVDIRDAAQALILAEQCGTIGERYIIASDFLQQVDLYGIAAAVLGRKPPLRIPVCIAYCMAWINQTLAALRGQKDVRFCTNSVFLSHIFPELDHSKATAELDWRPRPIQETIRDAVNWFRNHNQSTEA
jgi:dihydroflavonol-4-reductase